MQELVKVVPIGNTNMKIIIDQIENMLNIMTSFDLKPINEKLYNLTPQLQNANINLMNVFKILNAIPNYIPRFDDIDNQLLQLIRLNNNLGISNQISKMEENMSILIIETD
jgi:hypothetical protein